MLRSRGSSVGLSRIWKTVRSLPSRAGEGCTGRSTDPDSPAILALREALVSPEIVPASVPMLLGADEAVPMNGPSSERDFSAALGSFNVRSAPGLDGIGYKVLPGLSESLLIL